MEQTQGQPKRQRSDLSAAVAAVIHMERSARRWSRAEMATRAGMSDKTVQRIEDGDRVPDLTQVRRIAAAFGLNASGLIERAERRILEERYASTATALGVPSAAREQMADLELRIMTDEGGEPPASEPADDPDEEPERARTRRAEGR